MLVNGNRFLPQLPNAEIKKVLNEEQRLVFNSIQQHNSVFFGNPWGAMRNNQRQVNEQPLEEELEFAPEDSP